MTIDRFRDLVREELASRRVPYVFRAFPSGYSTVTVGGISLDFFPSAEDDEGVRALLRKIAGASAPDLGAPASDAC